MVQLSFFAKKLHLGLFFDQNYFSKEKSSLVKSWIFILVRILENIQRQKNIDFNSAIIQN